MPQPSPDPIARAARFRDLNLAGGLVLPNAWDAASARIFQEAGFQALGTTSSGIAYTRGLRDAERIGRDAMVREIASIVAAVAIPVTADIEAGYGPAPGDVALTVDAILDAGAVGINLEDRVHGRDSPALFAVEAHAAGVAAARNAGDRRGVPLVINARTDTFLAGIGRDLDERIALTVERGNAYLAAGADLVFVPGLVDLVIVRRLAAGITGPISLMAVPGAPPAANLFAAGASRVSLGQTAMLAMLGALRDIAADIRETGSWRSLEPTFYGFAETEALFSA